MRTDVESTWCAFFSKAPPVRHELRKVYAAKWLRVHSLAGAKRLPTSPEEEHEMLHRQQSVADRLLANSECVLVLTYANGYRGEDEPASIMSFRPKLVEGWAKSWSRDPTFADDLDGMEFAASRFHYDAALLPNLIRDVAYGRSAPLLILAMNSGRVYSPYDGGADLFFEDSNARELARHELRDWLSHRLDGL